jgi:hypothetical protein
MRFLLPEVAFQADPLLSVPNAQASFVTTGVAANFSGGGGEARRPLQPFGSPRIGARHRAVSSRPDQIDKVDEIADGQNQVMGSLPRDV